MKTLTVTTHLYQLCDGIRYDSICIYAPKMMRSQNSELTKKNMY